MLLFLLVDNDYFYFPNFFTFPNSTFLTFRYLSRYRRFHGGTYGLGIALVDGIQIHELGDGSLHGTIATADHSCLLQLVAGVVAAHLDAACHTLTDVDDTHTALAGRLQSAQQPRLTHGVAAAVGAHDDGLQLWGREHVAHDVLLDAGEQREHHDVRIHLVVRDERTREVGPQDAVVVEREVDAGIAEMRVVERVEGIEAVGILFCRTVATQQLATEVDTHLRHPRPSVLSVGRCQFDAGHEVLLAVGAQLSQRQLRSGEDDGLGEVLEHEGERRCRVGHRVGAVQNDEAVVAVVVAGNDLHQLGPRARTDVTGVDGRRELVHIDARAQIFHFRQVADDVVEVERLEGSRARVAAHSDGSARIDEQYFVVHSAKVRISERKTKKENQFFFLYFRAKVLF